MRCTATKRDGTPCSNYALLESDPPRCGSHSGLLGGDTSAAKAKATSARIEARVFAITEDLRLASVDDLKKIAFDPKTTGATRVSAHKAILEHDRRPQVDEKITAREAQDVMNWLSYHGRDTIDAAGSS